MLLAIDIGNTNVVLALLDAEDRVLKERRAQGEILSCGAMGNAV